MRERGTFVAHKKKKAVFHETVGAKLKFKQMVGHATSGASSILTYKPPLRVAFKADAI